jgi:hypothetical protein
VPLSNFAPRGFGFVHHSIAILYHEVPNPYLTIRRFCIAVGGQAALSRDLQPLLRHVLRGHPAAVLVWGPARGGKSFTHRGR